MGRKVTPAARPTDHAAPVLCKEGDLSRTLPENHNCVDRGYNTMPGFPTRIEAGQIVAEQRAAGIKKWSIPSSFTPEDETYIVHDHVWKAAGMTGEWGEGALCIRCLEKRLGRQLQPFDFPPDEPFNDPRLPGTRRRFERLLGDDVVLSLEDEASPQASKLDAALHAARGDTLCPPSMRPQGHRLTGSKHYGRTPS